jgi:hypothetical protein
MYKTNNTLQNNSLIQFYVNRPVQKQSPQDERWEAYYLCYLLQQLND